MKKNAGVLVAAMVAFFGFNAQAYETTAFCAVQGVDIFANRVAFKCDGGPEPLVISGVVYFAVSAVDVDFANRLVAIATVAAQKPVSPGNLLVNFTYETNPSTITGCDASNCRTLVRLSLRNPSAYNFGSPYVP